MSEQIAFADVLEAAEQLDIEAQADLVAILSRRLAQRGRERVAATVAQARLEFAAGQCPAMAPAEVAREAQSRGARYYVRRHWGTTCGNG
jgi:hypothetical protein